jgi:hypothetical protein
VEAATLRSKLLQYRFENFHRFRASATLDLSSADIEPRMHQILTPLMAVAEDETDREAILAHASAAQDALRKARGQTVEAEVLTVIRKLLAETSGAGVSMRDISAVHGRAYLDAISRPMAPRAIGHIVRNRLNLDAVKSHGVFVVPKTQASALERLYQRYGVDEEDVAVLAERLGETTKLDFGDVGDVRPGAA